MVRLDGSQSRGHNQGAELLARFDWSYGVCSRRQGIPSVQKHRVNRKEILASEVPLSARIGGGNALIPLVESVVAETEGPLRSIVRLEGRFDSNDQLTSPRFVCRIHFFAGSSHIIAGTYAAQPAGSHSSWGPVGSWRQRVPPFQGVGAEVPAGRFGKQTDCMFPRTGRHLHSSLIRHQPE